MSYCVKGLTDSRRLSTAPLLRWPLSLDRFIPEAFYLVSITAIPLFALAECRGQDVHCSFHWPRVLYLPLSMGPDKGAYMKDAIILRELTIAIIDRHYVFNQRLIATITWCWLKRSSLDFSRAKEGEIDWMNVGVK